MTIILETDRLILRRLICDDAEFYLELVNDPSWLRFIGDKGVTTLGAAREAILNGPMAMHERMGFSFYLTELKESSVPIGICGLTKRDTLDDVDIGFAFLPKFWGRGYAYEAASAVMAYGRNTFGLDRIVAIASPDNHSSIKLIEKIGLKFEQMLPSLKNDGRPTKLFARDFREPIQHIADMTIAT